MRTTLSSLEEEAVADVVAHLSNVRSRLFVLSGDASSGIAAQFAADLGALRNQVALIGGNGVSVNRQVSQLGPTDVVVMLDVRRYDRWLIEGSGGHARQPASGRSR